MARRSRKGRPSGAPPSPPPADAMRRGYARGRERDEAIRATLVPLRPGERPTTLKIAAAVALTLAIVNLVGYASGAEIDGRRSSAVGVAAFALFMTVTAAGLWRRRYWAVLTFECLLGLTIALFALLGLRAANVLAVVLALSVVGLGGWMFWKLVRVMARLQAPARGPRDATR